MLIDWFTVVAQIINFLILVWLLKRFLYKPILKAVEEREKMIENQLNEAQTSKLKALTEKEGFENKNRQWDLLRLEKMNALQEEIRLERLRLIQEMRSEFEGLHLKQKEILKREQELLSQDLSSQVKQEVFLIARKALQDLACLELEEWIVKAFLIKLQELGSEVKTSFIKKVKDDSEMLYVRNSFQLTPVLQKMVQEKIFSVFDTDVPIVFEHSPELVAGIELIANGYKICWSINDYLEAMENKVMGLRMNL